MVRNYGRNQRRLTANAARAHSSNIASFFGSNHQANQTDDVDTNETGRNVDATEEDADQMQDADNSASNTEVSNC